MVFIRPIRNGDLWVPVETREKIELAKSVETFTVSSIYGRFGFNVTSRVLVSICT